MRIICLFNLKAGVDPATYEAWARSTDLPGVNALQSVDKFSIHRAAGVIGSDDKAPYDYIEVIDIEAMDSFVGDVSRPEIQEVAASFNRYADNPTFILTEDL